MLLCLCGEYGLRTLYTFMIWGSSPHMRGIQSPMGMFPAYARFTPAHAGNTKHVQKNLPPAWVHPRSRGEYLSPVFLNLLISGSSPLTRGILLHAVEISRSCRFTPAHAGNTLLNQLNQSWYRVHPRSRGEYCPGKPLYLQFIGSPPLTRGIQNEIIAAVSGCRFTPAHAGNTIWKMYSTSGAEVHPRSRGEY